MDLSKYTTQDLLNEISIRADRADRVLAVLESLGVEGPKRQKPGPKPKKGVPRKRVLTGDDVLAVVKASSTPMTVAQVHQKIRKGTLAGMNGQLRRLTDAKKLKRSRSRPYAWTAA